MILSYTFVSVLQGERGAERDADKRSYCDYLERYCDRRHNFSENGNFQLFSVFTDRCMLESAPYVALMTVQLKT